MSRKTVYVFFFLMGLGLLTLNISGLFWSLRNDQIYEESGNVFVDDIVYNYDEFLEQAKRLEDESETDYAVRLNDVVNRGLAHYWFDEGIQTYHLRVPPWENYLLYGMSFVMPSWYEKYEYKDYKKAMERGVGLCSQHAIVTTGLLMENGIEAHIVGLSGHVVLTAKVDGEWIVMDSMYGVIIPHRIEVIEKDTRIAYEAYKSVEDDYQAVGEWLSPEEIAQIYGGEGNVVSENGVIGYVHWLHFYFEKLSYLAIWLIPLILMAPTACSIYGVRSQCDHRGGYCRPQFESRR